jgi:hypothetical protein
MKMKIINSHLKIFVIATATVSALVYAVATFYPETQPPVQLGEYALKDNDLLNGDTKAYRPWFENGAYMGDVIEYDIIGKCLTASCTGTPGTRSTTAPVGETDNTVLLAYANDAGYGTTKNWMARATFLLKENTVTDYWKARNIITYNNGQVDFLWNNLTPAQKIALDSVTLNDPDGDPLTSDAEDPNNDQPSDYFSPILNFIRGDRSNERDKPGGFLRRRYSLLGDITNTVAYIGPPEELLIGLNGFSNFASKMDTDPASAAPCSGYSVNDTKQGCRPGRVAAPTNGGTLEIFNENDGSEVYAYIPSMVIGKLDRLAARDSTYKHTFFLDGKLLQGSAQVDPDPDPDKCSDATSDFSGCNWRTILTGGGGPGFAGLFALDVTNPDFTSDKVLFEKTGNDIGHIYGQPRIAALGTSAAPKWYVFTGNGYGSVSDEAKLLLVSLDGSNNVTAISTGATGGLSSPALLSTDDDLMVEVAFAGDINGDLWMFKIDNANPAASTAHKIFDGDASQPITSTPSLVQYPRDSGSFFLHFGTGSIFSELDALDDTSAQAIYGLWINKTWIDNPDNITLIEKTDGNQLVTQTISEVNDPFVPDPTNPDVLRIMSSNNTVDLTSKMGWTIEFPNCGERLVGSPFVRTGRVQFVTTNPTGLVCSGPDRELVGDSWIMSLNYTTGEDANTIVYNLNGDNVLNDSDKAGGKPPVGLHLGKGNISQPTLARLSSGIDKMYINGLILQIPLLPKPRPLLSGHIDVQTDSPNNGEIATNRVSKHSEGYNIETNDRLSSGIDGHVHEYDTIHGVDYVDLFELEPRRGLANLAASSASTDPDSGACSDAENEKRILVDGRCIEAVEGELNRTYDTYTPSDHIGVAVDTGDLICADGDTEVLDDESGLVIGCREAPVSEVMATGSDLPLADDKEFIVVLANADLSFAGTLQIGCRAWPVVEYQDMVTDLIEGQTRADAVDAMRNRGLVFTLADIMKTTGPCPIVGDDGDLGDKDDVIDATTAISKGLSDHPTLRIGFGQRAILDEGVHGTRAQCVLGLHNYREPVCYSDEDVLTEASSPSVLMDTDGTAPALTCTTGIPGTPPAGYIKDPALNLHITEIPSDEGIGFRWRNGALTVQLLDTSNFELQDPNTLPKAKRGARRTGGTFASAFRVEVIGKGRDAINVPVSVDESGSPIIDASTQNGLLYESTMYWHYSDLADGLRTADPASTPCYGDPNWKSRINIELGGITLGEYQALTDPLIDQCENWDPVAEGLPEGTPCPLDQFVALLGQIDAAEDEDELNVLLRELADLLANDPDGILAKYAKYREYAPGHVPEQHLLPWDVDPTDPDRKKSGLDAIPAKVISIETIDLESRGPKTKEGTVIWTDIRQ